MERTQTTIRLGDDLIEELDLEAEENGVSRSEYVRQILRERHQSDELSEEVDTLRDRLESREERIETLEEQLAQRSQLEGKIEDLPDKIRDVESKPSAPFFVEWYQWLRRR